MTPQMSKAVVRSLVSSPKSYWRQPISICWMERTCTPGSSLAGRCTVSREETHMRDTRAGSHDWLSFPKKQIPEPPSLGNSMMKHLNHTTDKETPYSPPWCQGITMSGLNFVWRVHDFKEMTMCCRAPDTPVLWPVFTSINHLTR